jgi:catechol 2,3-dioxygenase-like lactoylglutathione lyase family enzyme
MKLEALDHVALSVHDIEHSAQWYIDVLGFERQHAGKWNGIPVFVGKDQFGIALFPLGSHPRGAMEKGSVAILHFAFRTSRQNFVAAQDALKRHELPFDFEDHEIAHSIYFRDPDGHKIEITTYEL